MCDPETTLQLLLDALDEAFDKPSWHGPNLRAAIRGLSSAQAGWRPAPGRHNIWELAVHAAYWKYVVRRKLTGEKRGSFPLPGSNFFPRSGEEGEAAWKCDQALLASEHRQLRQAVAALPAAALRDARRVRMIRGAAAHDLYHAGQIRLLRRLCPLSL
jgi:hypothetical protein